MAPDFIDVTCSECEVAEKRGYFAAVVCAEASVFYKKHFSGQTRGVRAMILCFIIFYFYLIIMAGGVAGPRSWWRRRSGSRGPWAISCRPGRRRATAGSGAARFIKIKISSFTVKKKKNNEKKATRYAEAALQTGKWVHDKKNKF